MNATIQIRIDQKTKNSATKTFKSMGLDMSTGVKLFLAQVVNTQQIPFPVMGADYFSEEKKLELVRDAKNALKNGKRHKSVREAHRDILGY